MKAAFDPKGIMNPGKIVDSPPMTEDLRIGPEYSARDVRTGLSFAEEGGFAAAIEMCNGQGACRKVLGGTMCPSYMVTRDERDSTRGRASALRAAMSGVLPPESLTGRRLHEVMDLCLECKGCKAECPSNVDMAKLKYEFLGKYHASNGHSLRDLLFGHVGALSRWGSFFAPLSNWGLRSRAMKAILAEQARIDERRELPTFASQSFRQWYRARGGRPETPAPNGPVVLFPDTFTDYNHPNLGIAATKVLEGLGFEVIVPNTRCCGRPMLSKGMMDGARSNARFNVDALHPYVERGAKIVGLEPSCILGFRDDFVDLLAGDARARAVGESTMLIEEFLLYASETHDASLDFTSAPPPLLFHGHCHQKALVGTGPAMRVLRSIPGADAVEIQSGCCGMAGSFGFEEEHYDLSMRIGEQVLFPAIRAKDGEHLVVSEGVSCRQQIEQGTGRGAKHLVEVLADAI